MKIAEVSPLYESVPPKYYGGTERIVSFLTEELVRQGHDVTLFASGDSITEARLVAVCQNALRLDKNSIDQLAPHFTMIEKVHQMAPEFDFIHFHIEYLHFLCSRHHHFPHISTLHGRLDIPDLVNLYREFSFMPVTSISNAQRHPLPWLNWQGTVPHGIPKDLLSFHERPGNYLAFLGRISPEKGPDRAIEIAARVGMPIKMAAKIDKADQKYYETFLKPLMKNPLVEFIGEIGEDGKNELLGDAYALLFPIDWPEPFGMVMIESLACGTPVIAFREGSVPEVLDHGETGFIVDSVPEAVEAVEKIQTISRKRCREVFEKRFTAQIMAENYLNIYQRLEEAEWTAKRKMSSVSKTNTISLPLQP